jgi:hypothetical protein
MLHYEIPSSVNLIYMIFYILIWKTTVLNCCHSTILYSDFIFLFWKYFWKLRTLLVQWKRWHRRLNVETVGELKFNSSQCQTRTNVVQYCVKLSHCLNDCCEVVRWAWSLGTSNLKTDLKLGEVSSRRSYSHEGLLCLTIFFYYFWKWLLLMEYSHWNVSSSNLTNFM